MATEYFDLPMQKQERVDKHLLCALEICGLDHHYLDAMLEALDTAVEVAGDDDE